MKTPKNCIFFDEIVTEYYNKYGQKYKVKLVRDLKKHLAKLSQRSEVIVITGQDTHKVTNWFIKNDLYKFTHTITNTAMSLRKN